ncbi:ribonuclease T2 family protein [Thalassovita aquimarina]|uniref:Ribonuclease T2 n=1 Tax=Thalassovita aquimarina TaxID=2785917 RepID=A0ABS5HQF5_9RHOB|nr:ribonuclease T2 [Thalassovita aquimarina]MBR9651143.1 ribonuclease T2 [Thalassovita aquimarina]
MRIRLVSLVFALFAGAAMSEGERSGDFDYYVLSLSWSPSWCALEGDARRSPQCDESEDYGWVLHGLWPQYHRGWPSFCPTVEPHPTRRMSNEMADIMGSSGLAWYQWKKHGSCSGLSASAYYDLARRAFDSVVRPPVFRKLDRPVTLPAAVVEQAFLKANPGLEANMLTITCKDGRIQEARLCLSKSLVPVPCGRDVSRDCSLKNALLDPIR